MKNDNDIIKNEEDIDVTITERILLGILIFGAILNTGFFGVIFYNQYDEKNKVQKEISEIKKDIHSLNFQVSVNNNTIINKAINNQLLETYSKGFDSGYECGYDFGHVDCHDGKPYSAEIPKE